MYCMPPNNITLPDIALADGKEQNIKYQFSSTLRQERKSVTKHNATRNYDHSQNSVYNFLDLN